MSRFRVASVSFINARPLIAGLDRDARVELKLAVPSALIDVLTADRADVALLPIIDYQRADDLTLLPAGCIASDGPTLTVRIFSRVPIDQIRGLACDPDSHTSVALARIILARVYQLRPELSDLARATDDPHQARLLIGDKVVCEEPSGFHHQLDLGEAWKKMTGLPFVFAAWMARPGIDQAALNALLARAKQQGQSETDRIIAQYAVPRGWPAALACQYLTQNLEFDLTHRHFEAIRLFHQLAAEEGIIPTAKPLVVLHATSQNPQPSIR